MGKLLSEKFQEMLLNKYPSIYRTMDEEGLLEQYTYALTEPAVPLIKKIEGMYDLLIASEIPSWGIHTFYSNFGGEFYDRVAENFQRRMLSDIVYLLQVRGTGLCVEYIASLVTGVQTEVVTGTHSSVFGTGDVFGKSEFGRDSTDMFVRILMDYSQRSAISPTANELVAILQEFLPFYVTAYVTYVYFLVEEAEINAREEILDRIKEFREDIASIRRKGYVTERNAEFGIGRFGTAIFSRTFDNPTEDSYDKISTTQTELAETKGVEKDICLVNESKTDSGVVRAIEELVNKLVSNIEEDIAFAHSIEYDESLLLADKEAEECRIEASGVKLETDSSKVKFALQSEAQGVLVEEKVNSLITQSSAKNGTFSLAHFGFAQFGNTDFDTYSYRY